ncbi:hypothetical protein [Fictibacillus sp. UD]|uniref:hypothetical protein n=1 Tax=Fictibacillus sp. UD TaxID=3038777 RepID=UPI003749F40A
MRDSYGTSGQVETPNGAKQAHRTPRGKRAYGTETNNIQEQLVFSKTYKGDQHEKNHTFTTNCTASFWFSWLLIFIRCI